METPSILLSINYSLYFAEQPSSSSMSTTTSSVTSMTSLEHSESASDYDPDHWDMTAWGEIDSSAGMYYTL